MSAVILQFNDYQEHAKQARLDKTENENIRGQDPQKEAEIFIFTGIQVEHYDDLPEPPKPNSPIDRLKKHYGH